MDKDKPYSQEDYEEALIRGYDLDDWNDYMKFYELGEKIYISNENGG